MAARQVSESSWRPSSEGFLRKMVAMKRVLVVEGISGPLDVVAMMDVVSEAIGLQTSRTDLMVLRYFTLCFVALFIHAISPN